MAKNEEHETHIKNTMTCFVMKAQVSYKCHFTWKNVFENNSLLNLHRDSIYCNKKKTI